MMKSDRNSKKKSGKGSEYWRKNDEKILKKVKSPMKVETITLTLMLSKLKRNQKVITPQQEVPLDSSEVNKHQRAMISLESKSQVDLKRNTRSLSTNLKGNMKITLVSQEMVLRRELNLKFRNFRKKKNDQLCSKIQRLEQRL